MSLLVKIPGKKVNGNRLLKYSFIIGFLFLCGNSALAQKITLSSFKDPCEIIDINKINEWLGTSFIADTSNSSGAFAGLTGQTLCSWIAPPTREVNSGIQRNVSMITVTFWVQESESKASEWLAIVAEPLFDEPVQWYKGLGDDAVESSALFVRKRNLVYSVRFSPHARSKRTVNHVNIEGPIAEMILMKVK